MWLIGFHVLLVPSWAGALIGLILLWNARSARSPAVQVSSILAGLALIGVAVAITAQVVTFWAQWGMPVSGGPSQAA
ncbi:hypothetical protein [Tautonia marina]|uniref:hypothetical protein n=1 Tax=Tautonia marina TaxID=2653855 RepID=UPI00126044D5|nr:hypothetical protein [Tautonia marina]